ncbi:MAG TPA: substrate-binding domain-containing protein [Pyrinomonadaceae bacterium]|nr:substrate-binding domain-containing protein [Pyrinomonadaceae bacterium]
MSSRFLSPAPNGATCTGGQWQPVITLIACLMIVAANVSCNNEARRGELTQATQAAPPSQTAQSSQAAQIVQHNDTPFLRVCADPNNLPFSNERREGFENKIAEVLAREMGRKVEYKWWAQRRGFIRNTLRAGECDVVLGVPASFELALTTSPYYRSSYVFVSRKDRRLDIRSFDDPDLRKLKIGVQLIGDDSANTPPAHALTARKIVNNVTGYTVYGDYSKPNPPAQIIEAVARGEVDVAVVWGPLAGYFASRQKVALEVVPVSPEIDLPFLPFVYDISMGVRRGDDALREELERVIERRRAEIEAILDDYGVPRVGREQGMRATS